MVSRSKLDLPQNAVAAHRSQHPRDFLAIDGECLTSPRNPPRNTKKLYSEGCPCFNEADIDAFVTFLEESNACAYYEENSMTDPNIYTYRRVSAEYKDSIDEKYMELQAIYYRDPYNIDNCSYDEYGYDYRTLPSMDQAGYVFFGDTAALNMDKTQCGYVGAECINPLLELKDVMEQHECTIIMQTF